ncbi:LysR family transcriptional regulator [Variovorax sp. OV329]|uniref:LysR family transcriptional regulator n=1 Tax=Variovorax sp. OV329 TaxID=1882825 RepID=UPI0008EC505C|nr:LysR family transcriptional regulator [Variovorax sp. OV329]SFL87090.1 DNA-binding transcriptional regulator, LysR family [Variovorax sp. OV329]
MRIDPVSLRLFVAVMEEGTIAAAAQREHLAPAAVSKRLSELEAALDTVLFLRSNKGTQSTAAAHALLGLARNVLNGLDDIAEQMAGFGSGLRGHVRVFANISAITQFLPDDLRSFMDAAPMVQVHLQERISTAIARAVADSTADIGILNAGDYGEPLGFLPYRTDELVLIVPGNHALARRRRVRLREALNLDFVGAHPGSVMNDLLHRAASEAGMPLRLRIQVSGYDAMALMVAAGMGVGVLPRLSARLYVPSLNIKAVALDERWAKRQLVLAVRDREALSPAARVLVEHLARAGGQPAAA